MEPRRREVTKMISQPCGQDKGWYKQCKDYEIVENQPRPPLFLVELFLKKPFP